MGSDGLDDLVLFNILQCDGTHLKTQMDKNVIYSRYPQVYDNLQRFYAVC